MPIGLELNLPDTNPKEEYLTLNNWKKGVITLLDRSRLPKDALQEADNLILVEDGQPSFRPGVNWYGVDVGADIDGMEAFDFAGAIHIVVAAGGVYYRSTDDGMTWDTCTGGGYTAGTKVNMNQYNNYLYLSTGIDTLTLYDGTTTLVVYTALTTPAAPSGVVTVITGTLFNHYYKISAVNELGFTTASTALTLQTSKPRSSWVAATEYITLTLPAYQATQTRFDIYYSDDNTNFYYQGSTSTPSVTYRDDGTAIAIPSTVAPVDNTTTGPLYAEFANVGSRTWGVRDPNNPYRIGFSSGTNPKGAFSNAYDGGYLDWQEGGKLRPVKVVDYRDGKNTPIATVFMNSSDGEGAIIQMSLSVFTVDTISITVPEAYKLPGSRGTPAPGSVINVLNDYMFYNSQAFYNLGSRAQFLNLLSTDEISANIRPTVKQIKNSAEDQIASIYFDAKVFFSVPYGTDVNSHTAVYDTERKAWLPKAFTIGFDKFLRYTDTDGVQRLLAYKNGDSRLSEISSGIKGDYGVAFTTSLLTGLYPTSRNRFEFQYTEEGELELSNPQGQVNIGLIGIERSRGFSTIGSETIESRTTTTGHDTFLHDSTLHDDTSNAIELYSESSVKRYFRVQKELNAVQWSITTNTLDSFYILRTLQTHGSETMAGKPREWKL